MWPLSFLLVLQFPKEPHSWIWMLVHKLLRERVVLSRIPFRRIQKGIPTKFPVYLGFWIKWDLIWEPKIAFISKWVLGLLVWEEIYPRFQSFLLYVVKIKSFCKGRFLILQYYRIKVKFEALHIHLWLCKFCALAIMVILFVTW